jgi:serine protease AprX
MTGMWNRSLSFALILALTFSLLGERAEARSHDPGKIDPVLLQKVLANPKADYDVIVRSVADPAKARDDRAGRAGDEVKKAGGKPKHSLGIVGGASARVRGEQILNLTNSKGVDYVFADAKLLQKWDPLVDAAKATTPGILSINAPSAWTTYGVTGHGVGVAIVDSGIYAHPDIAGRIAAQVDFTAGTVVTMDAVTGLTTTTATYPAVGLGVDPGGHGTHVAGLVAGDGTSSGGAYTGVAPGASLVDVRVIRADGTSNVGLVLQGLQWVLRNRNTYNIKVVNLSLGGPVIRSYKLDPLDTAAEVLTFAGISVVVSAGNGGSANSITTPGNDPFVISVGAIDDGQTAATADDTIASFSSRGRTSLDGLNKPDVVAPGRRMVSLRSPGSAIDALYPDRRVSGTDPLGDGYFRLSGTSMSAPIVAGTIALMLERNATLAPSQVKTRLLSSATPLAGYTRADQGGGRVDVAKTVGSISTTKTYAEGRVSDSFAKDMRKYIQGQPLQWKDTTFHGGVDSSNITWDNITWDNITWDNLTWDNLSWENLSWENLSWESLTWEEITWESSSYQSTDPLAGNAGWDLID